jgi:hypothetical protein
MYSKIEPGMEKLKFVDIIIVGDNYKEIDYKSESKNDYKNYNENEDELNSYSCNWDSLPLNFTLLKVLSILFANKVLPHLAMYTPL